MCTAEEELQSLEEEIARLQTLVARRDQLRAFLQMGRTLFAKEGTAEATSNGSQRSDGTPRTVPEGMLSVTSGRLQIRRAAEQIIRAEGPTRTKDLISKLEAQGILIGGKSKTDTVSVILSRARDRFKADRTAGWSLVEKQVADVASSGDSPVATDMQTQQEEATPAR